MKGRKKQRAASYALFSATRQVENSAASKPPDKTARLVADWSFATLKKFGLKKFGLERFALKRFGLEHFALESFGLERFGLEHSA